MAALQLQLCTCETTCTDIKFSFFSSSFLSSCYRYIAVTKPIKYAKHKNNRRAWLTIVFVWALSAAIGSPIVLGLNNTPDRVPHLCMFYNSDFILYSSLTSFYIPCFIMIYLYYSIFKVRIKITSVYFTFVLYYIRNYSVAYTRSCKTAYNPVELAEISFCKSVVYHTLNNISKIG